MTQPPNLPSGMSQEDYLSASKKHFNDAYGLHGQCRYDNAGYLAGYVVECGLKSLLQSDSPVSARSLGHDLTTLSTNALQLAALLSPARRRIQIPNSQDFQDLLAEWKPEERYYPEGNILHAKADSRLRAATEMFQSVIIPTFLDGRTT